VFGAHREQIVTGAASNGGQPATGLLRFKPLRAWLDDYRDPCWLIDGFLMSDAFDVFGGAEKSLKSWLLHHCAIAVAAGVPLFMYPEFTVPKRGPVLVATGEGGVDLLQDRIRHLCHGMYEIPVDEVLDNIIVSADIAPMSSPRFEKSVAAAIATYDPVLFQLDPLYVYFGEDREAGNVYSTGPALMGLRQLTNGRALQVAHHFTKAGADRLTLSSLTQAGMREAVDHWLLIAVDRYDLAAQRFELRVERGARRGLAWSKRADVILGPFNPQTLLHSGTSSVEFNIGTVNKATVNSAKVDECARAAVEIVKAEGSPEGVSTTWIAERINVKARATAKKAGIEHARLLGALRSASGPNRTTLHWYEKDLT
jgi:hypothetical protein